MFKDKVLLITGGTANCSFVNFYKL